MPDKEAFYSSLNMENITDIEVNITICIFNYTIQLCDVFESFHDIYLKMYGLDPAYFLPAPGLAWQACLKKQE